MCTRNAHLILAHSHSVLFRRHGLGLLLFWFSIKFKSKVADESVLAEYVKFLGLDFGQVPG